VSATAGYSGTPLPDKLGIRDGDIVAVVGDPGHAAALIAPLPDGARLVAGERAANVLVFFTTERSALAARIDALGAAIFPDGSCWVAWPKRASKVATDMTEDVVRELALPLGLVDNKVCAIDETWSGLRLVWRKELRGASTGRA
jgi:hypothetical protein